MLFGAITGGLAASSGSTGQIVAGTLAPALSYQIGQYFKENAAKNTMDGGNRGEEGSATHLPPHAVLGAAVASAGGDSALIGAVAAGGAEAAAPSLARLLYGKDVGELSADEKASVSAVLGVAAATLGSIKADMTKAIGASGAAKNAMDNNWGEVGHYSTMATILYLAGFSEQDAKAVALAAWSPDTDVRNAITQQNIPGGNDPDGHQQHYHLLDGESDPARVIAVQQELGAEVSKLLLKLKERQNTPSSKAALLTDPETQRILHAFGDSFAHVNSRGTHYPPVLGHGLAGTRPDDPDTNPEAYANYVSSLYSIAASVLGKSGESTGGAGSLSAAVSAHSTIDAQKEILAAAARVRGSTDSGLVNSPIAGCELNQRCSGNKANNYIELMYGIIECAPPKVDWLKIPPRF